MLPRLFFGSLLNASWGLSDPKLPPRKKWKEVDDVQVETEMNSRGERNFRLLGPENA